MFRILKLIKLAGLCFSAVTLALIDSRGDAADSVAPDLNFYRNDIRPILQQYCVRCHGADKQKGDLRLDTLDPAFAGTSAETWHDVLDNLNLGEMPPEDAPQPDAVSRRKFVKWVREGLDHVARQRQGSSGGTVIRRLTRYEYNNTLRDLLGIELDYAKDLPPEPASDDGFKNNGASLGVSPLQIEYYLRAARMAMDKAIVTGPAPEVHQHHFVESSPANTRNNTGAVGNRMPPGGRFLGKMLTYPRQGEFVVRIKVGAAVPEGMGYPRLRVAIGLRSDTVSPAKTLGEVDVTNPESEPRVYEFRGRIEEFPLPGHNPKFPGVTITVSNVYDDGLPPAKPVKFKAIAFDGTQKKEISAAIKKNGPVLPAPKGKQKDKSVKGFNKFVATSQRRIEELRLVDPNDKNQADIAFRLFDAQLAKSNLPTQVKNLAKQLKEDPDDLWTRYQQQNQAVFADHQQVLDRFSGIEPINRKDKSKIKTLMPKGPPRSTLVLQSLDFEGPVFESWPPESHTRLLPPSAADERTRAEQALERFITRAYRREVTESDLKTVMSFYDEIRPASASFEEAMRESFSMVLVSPEFLYLVEPDASDESRSLSQYELASRLSYFLWSTMPDESLLLLAKSGKLSDPKTLNHQVRAMISDARSQSFIEHFTDQWLDLSGIDRVAVNPEYYPEFDDRLKPMMRQETQYFFAEILRHDLSALNLIDSDFTMLNEPLARHYGLTGPRGGEFVRVALTPEDRRGGLLAQAGIMLLNSTGEDSHPIRRAVWLLKRMLDDPPAPPPPDVPELDSEESDFASLPLRRQLELHRTKEACNDCHRGIDPWGIAFERYDAVGKWRDNVLRIAGKGKDKHVKAPVDEQAILPNGQQVRGLDELKAYLLENDRRRFARALTSKLLAYGLGRSLVFADRPAVEALTDHFEQSDYRLSDLIVAIAQSKTFQSK